MFGTPPMPTTTTSAGRRRPSVMATPVTRSVPVSRRPDAAQEAGAVGGVGAGDDLAESHAERTGQRGRRRLDHGDVQAELTGGRGDLRADESGADHDKSCPSAQFVTQRDGVIDRPQHVHSSQVFGRATTVPATRRHDDAVGADRGSVVELNSARGRVEAGRVHAEQPVGVQVVVVGFEGQGRPRRCHRRKTPSTAGGGRRAGGPHRRRSVSSPSKPCARNARAADRPASEAPTTATLFTPASPAARVVTPGGRLGGACRARR